MSELADKLLNMEYNTALNNGMLSDAAINDQTLANILVSGTGLIKGAPAVWSALPSNIKLSYGLPIYRLIDRSLNSFGKLGKQYFKNELHPYRDYSKVLNKYVYYPNKVAGKTRNQYMNQYPNVRKGVREAEEKLHIDNKYPRNDANGFENLKVNFRGKDYAYQIKNNPVNERAEFYNIKPYDLAEKDYEQQYWEKVFEQIINDDIK